MRSRLASLIALVFVAWLSMVFGLFIVSKVIFEVTLRWESTLTPAVVGVSRVVLSGLMGIAWLLVWWKLANLYRWGKLGRDG